MEALKVKFIQDQNSLKPQYKGGFLKGSQEIIKKEGISAIYQGLFPTILKQGTNQMIRFSVMETLKEEYRRRNEIKDSSKPIPKIITGLFGAVAGAASVFGNTPIDVVKTRMQVMDLKLGNYVTTNDLKLSDSINIV